ncbi:MAG: DUF6056 family protein [Bacteroidales bacterium]|nr:DUF6056 family protein [Bacteroidales bacterium]MCM1414572.1 DUF6056 family protein [bacterium]MCM1422622.1 DUF6056 family protein [bacterium]
MEQKKGEKQNISGRMVAAAALFLLLALLPLFLLGRYNVMCIDDYDYGRRVHDVWQATGSFLASVQEAWQQNMDFYRDWQGTYLSCFLMAMCPMNFRYETAWVVPVLMIGAFASSSFVLGRHIFVRWLGCEKRGASLCMILLLFVFYQVIEAPFEGIYWYNGSTHYVLMQSLWFFLLTLVSESIRAESKGRAACCCAAAVVLSVGVGGGNLVTGLQMEILLAALVGYAIWQKRNKIAYVIIPFLTGTAGFLVNTLAPGNAQRGSVDMDEGYGAVKAIALSFYHMAVFAIRWTPLLVVILWLALLPLLWKLTKASNREFSHPVLVTAGAYCVLSAMFTPTLFAVGMAGLSRVDNIIQMTYYIAALLVTAYWMGYLSHRAGVVHKDSAVSAQTAEDGGATEAFGLFLERAGSRMSAVCLIVLLAVWALTADKNTYTSISALRSLAKGEAQTFYEEAMERYAVYTDADVEEVVVAPYSEKPYLFAFEDLSEDSGNWLNLAVANYYHKVSVSCARSTSKDAAP